MAIENFKHLIEAQSLEKKIKEHLDAIEEQKNRVQHIVNLRDQAQASKLELTSVLTLKSDLLAKSEKDLFQAETKFEKTNEHIPMARNEQEANALQHELDTLNPLIENLQESILELMDETESISTEIKEKDGYLEGSASSLKEITDESVEVIKKENICISSLEERVKSLLEQAGTIHKNSYLLSNERHRFNNPLCFVNNNACHVCRFTLNQVQAVEIEKGIVTESCPGCGRLLTPLSAKSL